MKRQRNKGSLEDASSVALRRGLGYCAATVAASGAAVYAANQLSKSFRTHLGISGKVAMVVIPSFGVFTLMSELTLFDARDNPEKYGLEQPTGPVLAGSSPGALKAGNVVIGEDLKFHHRAANYLYDHPFHLLASLAVPVVGGIFYSQSGHSHLKLSQKIMHTRVLGQTSVLAMLLSIMYFRDYMDRNGRFRVQEDADKLEDYKIRSGLRPNLLPF